MKKITPFFAFAVLAGTSLFFSGCSKKAIEQFLKHPGKDPAPSCSIQKIIFQPEAYPIFPIDTLTITYNAAGNPVSAIRKTTTENGPNYYFRYDNLNRLTDLIGIAENGFYRSWHRYVYNASGKVAVDSIYDYPEEMDNHPVTGLVGTVTTADYLYDAAGRVSKMTINPVDPGDMTWVENYSYDSDGNLTGYAYDNKVNVHQTNKVWQFLSRDYSVNNPVSGSGLAVSYTYNSYGLPTQVNATTGSFNLVVPGNADRFSFSHGTIVYSCQP